MDKNEYFGFIDNCINNTCMKCKNRFSNDNTCHGCIIMDKNNNIRYSKFIKISDGEMEKKEKLSEKYIERIIDNSDILDYEELDIDIKVDLDKSPF